jgi:hypothetical protein
VNRKSIVELGSASVELILNMRLKQSIGRFEKFLKIPVDFGKRNKTLLVMVTCFGRCRLMLPELKA